MEATEIYNGIARAVEAAKPAQEYCFLWIPHWSACMTKSEWSGWAQAIFSVLAIYFSSRIAFATLTKQRQMDTEDAMTLALLLTDSVGAHLIMGSDLHSIEGVIIVNSGFDRICESGMNLRLDLLSNDCRLAAHGLLSIASQARATLSRIIETNSFDAFDMHEAFDHWISRAEIHSTKIREAARAGN